MTIAWHFRWLKRWQKIRNHINLSAPGGQAKVIRCNFHIETLSSRLKAISETIEQQQHDHINGMYNFKILVPLWKRLLMRLKLIS